MGLCVLYEYVQPLFVFITGKENLMGRPRLTPEERAISEARRREKQREYLKKHRSKPEVKEKNREYLRQWRKDNPEKNAAIQIRYLQKLISNTTEGAI